MKRNRGIEVLKLYLALSVALEHASLSYLFPSMESNNAVLAFYMISGYFLVNSFESGKYRTPGEYSLSRIRRIYPYYIAAFFVLYLYFAILYEYGKGSLIKEFLQSLPEMFLLQNAGMFPSGINYPMWQMCCLIIAGHIWFALLQWNRQITINVISPLLSMGVLTYLANTAGNAGVSWWSIEAGFVYIPFVRAAAYIALGMMINWPVRAAVKWLDDNKSPYMPGIVFLTGVFACYVWWLNRYTFASTIPITIILICCFYSKSILEYIFKWPVFRGLDRLSLGIYLNHALFVRFMQHYLWKYTDISPLVKETVFLLVLITYSILMMRAVDWALCLGKKMMRALKIID